MSPLHTEGDIMGWGSFGSGQFEPELSCSAKGAPALVTNRLV